MKQAGWLAVVLSVCMAEAAETGTGFEMQWIWIGMFALAIVGIGILFISSRQSANMKKFYQEMLEKQMEMELKQNQILTSMSENIHDIVQKTLAESQKVIEGTNKMPQEKEAMLANVEEKLLDITNDLLYFLKLKSKKIEIKDKPFNLNNVLNEVSGLLGSKFKGKSTELIFEVNNSVPRYLIGDSLHFGNILGNLFEYQLNRLEGGELKLEVSTFNTYEDSVKLQFRFRDTGNGIGKEELDSLFVPYYDEENSAYVGLGLYIAKSLTELMNGSLTVQSIEGKGTTFILELPFRLVDPDNKRKYRLPSKELTEKNVFIADTNYNAALAIKKMFAYFKHDVKVLSKEDWELSMPKLSAYDIIIINESFFDIRLINYLKEIKETKDVKIIALNSLLNTKTSQFHDGLIDLHLFKPVNQERVFELIIDLYDGEVPAGLLDRINEEEDESLPRAKIYQSEFVETKGITQESFGEFEGKNLLIVEDNVINQKVLLNFLSKSGMKIAIANDGEQAVQKVKAGKKKFDMILMDINMPVMDGFTATQVIREERKFDSVPIVAFTALILESEKQKMFRSGINAFLAKPLNIGKLYSAFSMFISKNAIEHAKEEQKKQKEMLFEGLDIQKGIAHANNNEELYIELLKEFIGAYGKSDEVFISLVNEKRYEQIKMFCVDIKGLSGTIGANKLQHIISEIHQHILYHKVQLLENYKKPYQNELAKVKKAIESYIYSKEGFEV